MLSLLERMARAPFEEPDLVEVGPSGRRYGIRVYDRLPVTYWVDHGVKEIKVVKIEVC